MLCNLKDSPLGPVHVEVHSFQVTPYGMKCRLPVAEVDGVTIAVLPCQMDDEYLGLLLHQPPSEETQIPSRQLYYISWTFRDPQVSEYLILRQACLGGDFNNLQFRGKPVTPTWCDIYIAIHPATIGRRDGAHLLQHFVPDVAPSPFQIPRTLMQTLVALNFFPDSTMVLQSPESDDAMIVLLQNSNLLEAVHIHLGMCTKISTEESPAYHWAWASQNNSATWGKLSQKYVHDCATDHIRDWPNSTREFGDAERTIRLVFNPSTHAPEWTLVLSLGLSGRVYKEIQENANVYLPRAGFPRRRINAAAFRIGLAINLRSSMATSTSSFSSRFTSVIKHSAAGLGIGRLKTGNYSRNTSSVHALTQGRHTVSILSNADRASPGKTPSARVDDLVNVPNNPREAMEELPMENNAPRSREIQELKEAHDAQTRKLNEALAEIVLLKATFAQISQNNSIGAPPDDPDALEPP